MKSRWHLGAMILGATSLAQLEEDIAAAQVDLDAATLEAIAAVQIQYPNPGEVERQAVGIRVAWRVRRARRRAQEMSCVHGAKGEQ